MKLYLDREFFSENCGVQQTLLDNLLAGLSLPFRLLRGQLLGDRYMNLLGSHLKEGIEIFAP